MTGAVDPLPEDVFLDNRGLEPPVPMVRTLEAFERLAPGQRLTIHNDRVPIYLLPQLEARGAAVEIEELPGGAARVLITRTAVPRGAGAQPDRSS